MPPQPNIDSVLTEKRVFEPSAEFRSQAHIRSLAEYERLYREAEQNPSQFWGDIASELHWFKPWDQVLEWNCPWAKWFAGGQINLSYNCLDRHVATWRRNKAALIWEGEPGEVQTLTYQQLLTEVSKFANVLKSLGVRKGERVAIYMGMCTTYYGQMRILEGISLRVGAGELVCLLGGNASGKSTTLKTILGIVRPREGRVELFGEDVTRWPVPQRIAAGIAIVPENRRLFGQMTVRENLELGAVLRSGETFADDLDRVHALFPVLDRKSTPLN